MLTSRFKFISLPIWTCWTKPHKEKWACVTNMHALNHWLIEGNQLIPTSAENDLQFAKRQHLCENGEIRDSAYIRDDTESNQCFLLRGTFTCPQTFSLLLYEKVQDVHLELMEMQCDDTLVRLHQQLRLSEFYRGLEKKIQILAQDQKRCYNRRYYCRLQWKHIVSISWLYFDYRDNFESRWSNQKLIKTSS